MSNLLAQLYNYHLLSISRLFRDITDIWNLTIADWRSQW
jgi:hypothetical protein